MYLVYILVGLIFLDVLKESCEISNFGGVRTLKLRPPGL